MKTIALLVTHGFYPSRPDRLEVEYSAQQLAVLVPALARYDIAVEPVFWQDDDVVWSKYAAIVPLMAWNYPQEVDLFLRRLEEMERAGSPVFNRPEILRTNMDKSYLAALAAKGAPIPPTIAVSSCTDSAIANSFDQFDVDEIIIKPNIGAGAWRQARLKRGQPIPHADSLPPHGALIQPFLRSVTQEGELSLLYFNATFSHAVMKRPKDGDYRTQGQHGACEQNIIAPDQARDAAHLVLQLASKEPLTYARVDLVRGPSGDWLLMELELIEPWLYLFHDGHSGQHGAALFAAAINAHLG